MTKRVGRTNETLNVGTFLIAGWNANDDKFTRVKKTGGGGEPEAPRQRERNIHSVSCNFCISSHLDMEWIEAAEAAAASHNLIAGAFLVRIASVTEYVPSSSALSMFSGLNT